MIKIEILFLNESKISNESDKYYIFLHIVLHLTSVEGNDIKLSSFDFS